MLSPPPPSRHRGRGDSLLRSESPITAPTQAYEFPARPAGSARQCFVHIHSLSLLHSAAVPFLSSADLAVADSPLFARRNPAALQRRRSPVRRPVSLILVIYLQCSLAYSEHLTFRHSDSVQNRIYLECHSSSKVIARNPVHTKRNPFTKAKLLSTHSA